MTMRLMTPAILLSCVLCACSTTNQPPASAAGQASGLKPVVGKWRISHYGAPTVWNDRVPDPAKEIKDHMKGTTIAIEESGKMSFIAPGHAASHQVTVLEESPLYLKVGAKDRPIDGEAERGDGGHGKTVPEARRQAYRGQTPKITSRNRTRLVA